MSDHRTEVWLASLLRRREESISQIRRLADELERTGEEVEINISYKNVAASFNQLTEISVPEGPGKGGQ